MIDGLIRDIEGLADDAGQEWDETKRIVAKRVDGWSEFQRELLQWCCRYVGLEYVVEKKKVGSMMVQFLRLIDGDVLLFERRIGQFG